MVDVTAYYHPMLKLLQDKLSQQGVYARCEVLRPRDTLGFKPAKIYLHFFDAAHRELSYQTESWDDELNSALIMSGIRAISEENESIRFSMALRSELRSTVNRFGEGYYSSVLLKFVRAQPYSANASIEGILRFAHGNAIDETNDSYVECSEMVQHAIERLKDALQLKLGYSVETSEKLIVDALAKYLDDRFSITNRRLLGWL